MIYDGHHFWGMHLIWWFAWVIFLFIIFRRYEPMGKNNPQKDTPLDILQRRFASSEITTEEYQEMKKIIENDSSKQQS